MKPCDVKTFKQLGQLRREAMETRDSWLMIGERGEVCIHNQRNGEPSTGSVTLKRSEFLRMVRWYMTEQKPLAKGQLESEEGSK